MNNTLKNIYDASPVVFQNWLLTGFSILLDRERYSGNFTKYQKFLEKSQWYTSTEIEEYQNDQLKRLVKHAYETVPYYHNLFNKMRIKPQDIATRKDLYKIPVLTKKDIHDNFDQLRSRAFKTKELRLGHTSGTTGAPLEILYDSNVIHMTYAMLDRQYKWAGVRLSRSGDRVAILRGNVIAPIAQSRPPFWRHNYYHNHLLMSSFHLSNNNLPHYVKILKKFQPVVIDGYPSTVYVLARYINSAGDVFPVNAVLTSSETLYDFQREEIEKAFQCKIFDYYGAAERVVFGAECEKHEGHHLCSEYGITEILNEDWQPAGKGKSGYMVGTSLHNYGMPMIRYVSNDISSIKTHSCSCGRNLPLMEDVATKSEDILALKDGRMISPSVLTHPFKPMHGIEASQIIQEDYDCLVVKLIPNAQYKDSDRDYLVHEFKKRLGNEMRIDIQLVNELPRTNAGKFKWVISKVKKGVQVPS